MTDAKTLLLELRGDTQWRQNRAALRGRWRGRASIPSRRRNADAVSGSYQDQRFLRSGGKAICGFRVQTEGYEGSDRDARPSLRRIHDAHEGGRHRTPYPSSVRGTTCCGKGTNQAAAGIAERRRRGASAEPERGGRPPSATYRDLLRSVRLPQLERRSVRKLDHFDRLRGGDRL